MRGEEHLTKPRQFALVHSQGSSWVSPLVVMRVLPNGLALSRTGLSVSKRVGKAVTRNRVKRWLREILRAIPLEPGWDMVFIVRPAAADADYHSLRSAVESLLSRARLVAADDSAGSNTRVKISSGGELAVNGHRNLPGNPQRGLINRDY